MDLISELKRLRDEALARGPMDRWPWDELNNLPDPAVPLIAEYLERCLYNPLMYVCECESPIEKLMYVAIIVNPTWQRLDMLNNEFDPSSYATVLPQHNIKLKSGRMIRADFCVMAKSPYGHANVVIECDGYDFHERTKEQAERDRARDRELASLGYTVFRFLGSEIYRSPYECADQVLNFVAKRVFPPFQYRDATTEGNNGGAST